MNKPKKYRKKPVVIEAMRFYGTTAEAHAVYMWVEDNTQGSFDLLSVLDGALWPESGVSIDPRDGRMVIATLDGVHWVDVGDFVIRGVKGEFYSCKPDIFELTYDPCKDLESDVSKQKNYVTWDISKKHTSGSDR